MATHPLDDVLSEQIILDQAVQLREAYSSLQPIGPIRTAYPAATIADAYAIQEANTAQWLSQGRKYVGAKIGLTAKVVQKQFGVDQPDFGVLFADMAIPDGNEVPARQLLQPRVEAEIAFVLARAPDPEKLTAAELLDCVDYALPAIEIVDSRIENWDISIVDTIADNASSGLFVLGTTPTSLGSIDLRLCGMVMEKNGEPVSFGAGAACLGNPLHALGWLAAKMAEVGRPLQARDIVLAGALGSMIAVAPGDTVEARIEGVGAARVRFGKA